MLGSDAERQAMSNKSAQRYDVGHLCKYELTSSVRVLSALIFLEKVVGQKECGHFYSESLLSLLYI